MQKIAASQVVILLLDYYKQRLQLFPDDLTLNKDFQELKTIIVLGDKDNNLAKFITLAKTIYPFLNDCLILPQEGHQAIDSPSMRYFQSCFALHKLTAEVVDLDLEFLEAHYQSLLSCCSLTTADHRLIDAILNGEYIPSFKGKNHQLSHADYVTWAKENYPDSTIFLIVENILEYAENIKVVKEAVALKELSSVDHAKLILIIKCTFYSFIAANSFQQKPFNELYKADMRFSSQSRGRINKGNTNSVNSCHLGLMKSYMPLPPDDAFNMDQPSTTCRPVDRSTCNPEAPYPIFNAKRITTPYVNGRSGLMLCHLDNFNHFSQQEDYINNNKDQIKNFLMCFMYTFLFCSGGHSFQEFFDTLELDVVQDRLSRMGNFPSIEIDDLLRGNQHCLDLAIDKTIRYNKLVLARNSFLNEVTVRGGFFQMKSQVNQPSSNEEKMQLSIK